MSEHDHVHGDHDVSQHDPEAAERNKVPFYGKRIYAIRELLIARGVLSREDIQRQIEYMDARSPANGARLVARAWVDPAFKQRLLSDPKAACAEMGIDASGLTEFVVLENTETVHNLVVCTLCSCYPRPILGRPPDWYKSFAYRSRAVVEPRAVMAEFGTRLPDSVEVRVFDSSADIRYLVLPLRPPGTESLSEAELAELVTRDSLIGVTEAQAPAFVH
ncbi:MAG: nitrile hydratase subunit alpha [Chloroflexi bacterium]|nr:nitrile hydratase subunit alpha [Chloroflexota bacterium]MBV9602372.1 nitrile hydratase subunit alpha [Chloroflexota bacterium]